MQRRVRRVYSWMRKEGICSFLLTDLLNIRYLTGFTGSNAYLFLTRGKSFFFTDFRYKEQSQREVKADSIKILTGNFFEDPPPELRDRGELAFEEHSLTYKNYCLLKKRLRGVKLRPAKDFVAELRMAKEEGEVSLIRKAAAITDDVFSQVLNFLRPGMTEREVALKVDFLIKEKGELSFPTIVASGPNAALPHARPEEKEIREGETIIIDMGATFQGYASDMTRTVFLGYAPEKAKEIYKVVQEALELALAEIRAGKKTIKIDALARDHIKKRGYERYFGHSLGHGVGLAVHERPCLSYVPSLAERLVANSVVTIEPGIYLPDFGGVRIEELVLVRRDGAEVLSKSQRELLVL